MSTYVKILAIVVYIASWLLGDLTHSFIYEREYGGWWEQVNWSKEQ